MRRTALIVLLLSLMRITPAVAEGQGIVAARAVKGEAIAHLEAARELIDSGQTLAGIAEQTRAIELNPFDAAAFRQRAEAWHLHKRYELAVADYTRALQLSPRDAQSHFGRGLSLHALGDATRALENYAKAAALRPGWSEPYRMRGHALMAQGRYPQAAVDFRRGLDEDPKDVANLVGLGYARLYMGELPVAADNFVRALRLSNDMRAMLFLYIVRARQGIDGRAELERHANRVPRKAWPNPVLQLYLGAREPQSVLAEARGEQQECEAHFYVGQWQLLKGQRPDALASMTQALKRCIKTQIEYEAAVAALGIAR
ncbi:MAG: tetratricopeptide repeat protein [Hyphomicrobiaceae bacterium]|nr:tetratricopeptide repeat protein [Hyphomicrobiaceae bacterium]